MFKLLMLAVAVLVVSVACELPEESDEPSRSGNKRVMDEVSYGSQWPLTLPRVTLVCEKGPKVGSVEVKYVFVDVARKRYAVNGTAMSLGQSSTYPQRLYDLKDIWRRDRSVNWMIDEGLKLC